MPYKSIAIITLLLLYIVFVFYLFPVYINICKQNKLTILRLVAPKYIICYFLIFFFSFFYDLANYKIDTILAK